MSNNDENRQKKLSKTKRITTVPQFKSTKKLIEQNKKILSLVSNHK